MACSSWTRVGPIGAGLWLTAAAASSGAPAKPPPASPKPQNAAAATAALTQLKKDEATVKSGRLSLSIETREGELTAAASGAAARAAAMKSAVTGRRQEYHLFSGPDWRQELTLTDAQGSPEAHVFLGIREKVGRALQEKGHGDQTARTGMIGMEPEQDTIDRILSGHGSELLRGYSWTAAQRTGSQLVLTGSQGTERATATLRTQPRYALEKLVRTNRQETPVGKVTQGMEVTAVYEVRGGVLLPKNLEELVYATPPIGKVAITTYKVEGAQINEPVRADELVIAFPQGTKITDSRFDPPLRYAQGEKDLTQAELKALHEKQSAGVAKVGTAAPGWALKTLDGKDAKLDDYKGKVVLLTWFASWCGPCNAEAPKMEKNVWQKYRERGLVVIGINAGEQDDPQKKASEFVQAHGVTYPVVLDTADEASQAYQIQAFPTIAIIDRQGVLRYQQPGFDEEGVLAQLEKLLKAP